MTHSDDIFAPNTLPSRVPRPMDPWKRDFIEGLKRGIHPPTLARQCAGLPLAAVQAMRTEDEAFAAAWDDALREQGTALLTRRALSPRNLERALASQRKDEDIAAYFGMTLERFMITVQTDEELDIVYQHAREAAKVTVGAAQYDAALAGSNDMLKWYGKQHMGQAEKSVSDAPPPAPVSIEFNINDPGDTYRRIMQGGLLTESADGVLTPQQGIPQVKEAAPPWKR